MKYSKLKRRITSAQKSSTEVIKKRKIYGFIYKKVVRVKKDKFYEYILDPRNWMIIKEKIKMPINNRYQLLITS